MPDLNVLLFLTLGLAGFITAYLYQTDEYTTEDDDPVSHYRDRRASIVRHLSQRPIIVDQPAIRGFASAFFDIPDRQDQRGTVRIELETDFIAGILNDSSCEEEASCDFCA